MERNQLIGFVLLLILGGTYLFWNSKEQQRLLEQNQADSLAQVALMENTVKLTDTAPPLITEDSELSEGTEGAATPTAISAIKEEIITISNEDLSLSFTNKGGFPVHADIKGFKTYEQEDLILFDGEKNQLQFLLPYEGKILPSNELLFEPEIIDLADGST